MSKLSKVPWAYAIATPGGEMYDGEYAIFSDYQSAQRQVECLNDELPENGPCFAVVPLIIGNAELLLPRLKANVSVDAVGNTVSVGRGSNK